MKKNKLLVYICIFLIIAIFVQLIYFKKNNKNNMQEADKKDESEGIIINIDDFYKYYSEINISKDKLEKTIYKFVTEDLSTILTETKDNGPEQNNQYYKNNELKINNMGIYSKDDFILIAEDLKNCTKSDNAKIYEITTEFEDEYANDRNNYLFNIIIKYTNSASSNIKCKIPINNIGKEKSITTDNSNLVIAYSSNSEIAKMFNNYNGPVTIEETIETINKFQNSLKEIYDNTSLKSINDIAKYYSENRDYFTNIGIVSENDFKTIVFQIKNDLKWKENNSHYYKLDFNDKYEDTDYIGCKLTILYNYTEKMDVKLYLCKNSSKLEKIKISGTNGGI